MYADVAVCLPLVRTFVYRLPASIETGCRVVVPFRKRAVEGFVIGLRKDAPRNVEIHTVTDVIDAAPLVRPEIFELCKWISDYYVAPLGEVLRSALPPGITAKHVERGLKPATASVPDGFGKDVVERFSPRPILTEDQSRALKAILDVRGFHPVLLHGVTGSGKTEIYMRASGELLAAGKTSLILVPEIGLTPQLTDRFAERFPGRTAVIHSSLTKRQRIDEWLRIYRAEAT